VTGCTSGAANRSAQAPRPRPNILVITTDQQTITALSAAGNPYVRTPALDRLAAGGVRFEQSYCAAPICSPSRSALITGRMPHETGVNYNIGKLNPGVPTLGQVFRDAGYETVFTGKWHIPSNYPEPASNEIPGFDVLPLKSTPQRPFMGDDNDGMVADAAIAFLRRPHDRPFVLNVSLLNPHDICYYVEGRKQWPKAPTLDAAPPLPANFAVAADEPEFVRLRRNALVYGAENHRTLNWTEADWRNYLYVYYRMVERADAQVSRVLQALTDAGLERDTLVIFTADHGEGLAAHHWVVKLSFYENPAKVPFIVRYPRLIPAGVVDHDHLVSGTDLVPTACGYAGVPTPPQCRGVSVRGVIDDPKSTAPPAREFVVSEMATDPQRPEVMARMVRTKQYKYIAYSIGKNKEQLFDLTKDPGEMHDLAADPDMADELSRHRELLRRWVQETGDHFPVPR
jgi:arylsulfatase A-like enzyme